jgi:hypothetical protein
MTVQSLDRRADAVEGLPAALVVLLTILAMLGVVAHVAAA